MLRRISFPKLKNRLSKKEQTLSWHLSRDRRQDLALRSGVPATVSGPQKGPAERGNVKNRQKVSETFSALFGTFRHFSLRTKNIKYRQKVSKIFSTLFDNFRAAPVFRPVLGGSDTAVQSLKSVQIFCRVQTISRIDFIFFWGQFRSADAQH